MQTIIKSFEELSTQELYQLLKLRVDVFVVEQDCPYPELDDEDQSCQHYMLMDEDQIAVYLRTFERESSVYGIGRIVTHSSHRGQGLGRKLIQRAIDDISEISNVTHILIHAQAHLIKYYESFGFEICSEEYLEDNIPHINLQISLSK